MQELSYEKKKRYGLIPSVCLSLGYKTILLIEANYISIQYFFTSVVEKLFLKKTDYKTDDYFIHTFIQETVIKPILSQAIHI